MRRTAFSALLLFALAGCDAGGLSDGRDLFELRIRDGSETTALDFSRAATPDAEVYVVSAGPGAGEPHLSFSVAVAEVRDGLDRRSQVTVRLPLPSGRIAPGTYEADRLDGRIAYRERRAGADVSYVFPATSARVHVESVEGGAVAGRFVIEGGDSARVATARGTFRAE